MIGGRGGLAAAAAVTLAVALVGCSGDASNEPSTTLPVDAPADGRTGVIGELPPGSRDSTAGRDPRTVDDWVVWSTCGEGSRAEEAEANGGAAAGWPILDDFIWDPGISVGDYQSRSCAGTVALLEAGSGSGFDIVAALVVATDLNLNSGAENCPAADQSVRAAHLALASLEYAGPGTVTVEPGTAIFQLIDLLTAYNSGDLCR